MYTIHHADLSVLLETLQPSSLLLVDPNPDALPEQWLASSHDCHVKRLQNDILSQLETLGRYDLGIVANTLEHMDRREAGMVLARLRDINTRRFVALVPLGKDWEGHATNWETSELLGYGMVMLGRYEENGRPLTLFHYNIRTYKTTPEWFSARNWANPENWQP